MTTTLSLAERNEMLQIYSDFHKDAYGFRPRGLDYSAMSDEQLQADFERFAEVMRENEINEAKQLEADLKAWDYAIMNTIQLGARDRKTAIKWLFEGENDLGYDNPQNLEHFVWRKGILWSDEGKQVLKELEEIYRSKICYR
jgi:hypothetical protein